MANHAHQLQLTPLSCSHAIRLILLFAVGRYFGMELIVVNCVSFWEFLLLNKQFFLKYQS
jgi:hypothetical protein